MAQRFGARTFRQMQALKPERAAPVARSSCGAWMNSRGKSKNFRDYLRTLPGSQELRVDVASDSGYILARMWHDIVLAPEAAHEPRRLTANIRSDVRDAI